MLSWSSKLPNPVLIDFFISTYNHLFPSIPWLIHHPMFLPHLWLSEPFSTAPDESRVYSSYTSHSLSCFTLSPYLPQFLHHYYSKSHRGTQGRNRFEYKRPFSAIRVFLEHSLQSRASAASSVLSPTVLVVGQFWDVSVYWANTQQHKRFKTEVSWLFKTTGYKNRLRTHSFYNKGGGEPYSDW